jgi:hypothetical protein
MEAIVIAALVVGYIMTGVTALGPHQETPPDCQKTAIVSDSTGEVLYYNCK